MDENLVSSRDTLQEHILKIESKFLSGEEVLDCFVCKNHLRGAKDSWLVDCSAPTEKRNYFSITAKYCTFFCPDKKTVLQYRQNGLSNNNELDPSIINSSKSPTFEAEATASEVAGIIPIKEFKFPRHDPVKQTFQFFCALSGATEKDINSAAVRLRDHVKAIRYMYHDPIGVTIPYDDLYFKLAYLIAYFPYYIEPLSYVLSAANVLVQRELENSTV